MNASLPDDGRFKTADLYFAAFLKTADVKFLDTERDGDRTVFIFEKADNIRELKGQYFARTAKVSALSFADEVKALKTLTHMGR